MHPQQVVYRKPKNNGLKIFLIILAVVLLLAVAGCVVGIIIFVSTMAPVVSAVDAVQKETVAKNRAREIVIQMHNYHDRNRRLPPSYSVDDKGNPLHSWRVLLLEYLGCPEANQIDYQKPWNDPGNLAVLKSIDYEEYFGSPRCNHRVANATAFVTVSGKDTTLRPGQSVPFEQIKIGTSQNIILFELPDSDIPWYEPRDLSIDEVMQRLHDTRLERGIVVATADANTRVVRTDQMKKDVLKRMLTPAE